jgi:hypothetical protein
MLREGIVSADYVPISSDRIKEMRNNNELHTVEALQLSFKNILQINNLQGFDALVKLQSDNNIIEKIENLETLVNLTWIDLSFNNIAVIEGMHTLTKLTDLSLFSNCITRLQGMDTLSSLNVLSVGKNEISSLDEVQYLRRFRNLKMLTLAGNAFPDADYRAFVIAHLSFADWKEGGHLTALDYRLVETFSVSGAVSVSSAREQYQDAMLELADKEKMDSELAVLEQERQATEQVLVVARISGVKTIIGDMLAANPSVDKLRLLPGYDEQVQDLIHEHKTMVDPFITAKGPVVNQREHTMARFECTIVQRREKASA